LAISFQLVRLVGCGLYRITTQASSACEDKPGEIESCLDD